MLALLKFNGKKWEVRNNYGLLYDSYVHDKAKDFQVAYNLGVSHAERSYLSSLTNCGTLTEESRPYRSPLS